VHRWFEPSNNIIPGLILIHQSETALALIAKAFRSGLLFHNNGTLGLFEYLVDFEQGLGRLGCFLILYFGFQRNNL
jgi:hypothetical protein